MSKRRIEIEAWMGLVQVLFELILAANYLDIKSLLDLTCAKVASMIKGKNTEEIRKQYSSQSILNHVIYISKPLS